MRNMYAPHVADTSGRPTAVALRTIQPTLEEAKAVLEAEVERAGKPALRWTDEFGGASAQQGGLLYEVLPVQVNL